MACEDHRWTLTHWSACARVDICHICGAMKVKHPRGIYTFLQEDVIILGNEDGGKHKDNAETSSEAVGLS